MRIHSLLRRVAAWVVVGSATALLCSCVGVGSGGGLAAESCLRRVDCGEAPGLEDLAGEARLFAEGMYPRVCALLLDADARPPRRFDLVFRPLKSRNTGEAHLRSRRIVLNSGIFTNATERGEKFRHVFVHEMAHLAALEAPRWPRLRTRDEAVRAAWAESLADYARYRLLGADQWTCAECNSRFPHYLSGYSCGGAFLLFLEDRHGTNLVRQLVRELRERTYHEDFFMRTTGRELAAWWTEFRETPAFRPAAREALELRAALGYEGEAPPSDVLARFDRWVERHPDPFVGKALAGARWPGSDRREIRDLITLSLYVAQPGGPAERFLLELRDAGRMPGMDGKETGWVTGMPGFAEMESRRWPVTRTISGSREGDPARYHYRVSRASAETGWRLERAWRSDDAGNVLEEYSVDAPALR
jgi:hypothetical protein